MGKQLVAHLGVSDNSVNYHLGVLVCLLAVVLYPVRIAKVFQLLYLVDEVHHLAGHDLDRDVKLGRKLFSGDRVFALF